MSEGCKNCAAVQAERDEAERLRALWFGENSRAQADLANARAERDAARAEVEALRERVGALRLALAEEWADLRCDAQHPQDGGTCFRCRKWADDYVSRWIPLGDLRAALDADHKGDA